MKYACGNEPMVGDVVVDAAKFDSTREHTVSSIRCDGGIVWVLIAGEVVHTTADWWLLVRRASAPLPLLDGSGVFGTEKPKHRYPRHAHDVEEPAFEFRQAKEGADWICYGPTLQTIVKPPSWGEQRIRSGLLIETFDHHAKPDTRFDEGGMYRSEAEPKPTIEQLAKRVDEMNRRLTAVEKQNNSYFGSKPTEWQK